MVNNLRHLVAVLVEDFPKCILHERVWEIINLLEKDVSLEEIRPVFLGYRQDAFGTLALVPPIVKTINDAMMASHDADVSQAFVVTELVEKAIEISAFSNDFSAHDELVIMGLVSQAQARLETLSMYI